MEDEANKENITIKQKCYIKAGETFFSRSGTSFSTISKEVNIEDTGLIKTKNVIPQILRKRSNITNKLSPYTIKEIDPLSSVYVTSAGKRKLELEEINTKKRKIDYLSKTISIKEEHMHILEKEHEATRLKEKIINYFNKKWRNLDTDGFYRISAFTVNNKGKYPYVGVLAEKDDTKSVYFLKGSFKNFFINIYNTREKRKEEGYVLISFNEMELIVLPTEETIITFNTNRVTTFNGHSFAKVENVQFFSEVLRDMDDLPFKHNDIQQIEEITMQEIKGHVKVIQCRRLEEIPDKSELRYVVRSTPTDVEDIR